MPPLDMQRCITANGSRRRKMCWKEECVCPYYFPALFLKSHGIP